MKLESNTILPVPLSERHGRARDLFTVWFGANLILLTIVTGALAATVFHLPFRLAVLGLVLGNLVGGVFMALHAAQGPTLGVPQMVQTRAQFGSLGALVVLLVVIAMYVGFLASNLALGAETLHTLTAHANEVASIVILGILSIAGTIFGYDLIHTCTRIIAYASGAAFLVTLGWLAFGNHLPPFSTTNAGSIQGFLGAVSVAALWQIAYAPYVSDYSRYLPAVTGVRTAFWATYSGSVLGSTLPMIVGALVGSVASNDAVIPALSSLTQPIAPVTLIVFSIAMIANNAMNLYCGALASLTALQTWRPDWRPGWRARAVISLILLVIALALAIYGRESFLESYTSFILLLFYVLIPWTAINLIDYYVIKRAQYDVPSIFQRDGGIYGRFNVPALVCYFLGTLVQVPFVSTPIYTGPVARALGDADLSWLVGLIVTSLAYYALAGRSSSLAPGVAGNAEARRL
jgi:nucleobase:cation symporter-1, NCS1 family